VEAGPSAAAAVTIAVAGTPPSADQASLSATGVPRRAWRVKKAAKKKSTLYVFFRSLEGPTRAHLDKNVVDVTRATSVVQLQLEPGTAAAPASAAAAPEPPVPEGPVPAEVDSEADAALPDLPPLELRQEGAGPSGGEQVETPDAAHTDGIGMRLPAHDWLPGSGRNVLTTSYACRCPAAAARGCRRSLGESP
jgi:hypothetical protein